MRKACVGPLLIAALAGSPVLAAQLTNLDSVEHRVTITEKNRSRDVLLKPSETLRDICNSGCTMQVQGGENYTFDGNEMLSIEERIIFVDDSPQPPAESSKK